MQYDNRLYADQGYVERCIMIHLAALREKNDPYFQEQALLAAMWSANPQVFWYHFGRYVKLHPNQPIPIHYQEAAYLFGVLAKNPNVDKFPIDSSVKERFSRFDKILPQYDGKDITEVRKAVEPMFGDTYFYQYYVMSNLPEY